MTKIFFLAKGRIPAVSGLLFFCLVFFELCAQWRKAGNNYGFTEALNTIKNELYSWGSVSGDLYIVKWDSLNWFPVTMYDTLGGSASIKCFLWYNNELYASGPKIGKWNGSNWTILGAFDGGFNLYDMEVFNGNIYFVGGFYGINGVNNTKGIAKWNGTNWSAVGAGLSFGSITPRGYALQLYKNDLYVGGDFGMVGNVPANNIARWNGTQWNSVGTAIPCGRVQGLVVDTINDFLYAGGSCYYAPMRWDGYSWTNFLDSGFNGNIYDLEMYHNELYAVGYIFGLTGGGEGVAKWNGTYWEAVGGGTTPGGTTVYAAEVYKDELYVAGGFTDAGGDTSIKWIARWYSPPDTTCKFLQSVIESMLSLSAPNGVSDTFYSTDSVAVQFYNNIASSTFWQWDFGDGDTGSGKTPMHYYTAAGTYTVSVIVNYPYGPNGPCIDTAYKTITVIYGVVGVNEHPEKLKFKVYPNPAKREINIEMTMDGGQGAKEKYIARVKNSLGQNIYEKKFEIKLTIDSSKFKRGIYVVEMCDLTPSRGGEGKVCHSEKMVIE